MKHEQKLILILNDIFLQTAKFFAKYGISDSGILIN
jgi:hypothetical protein